MHIIAHDAGDPLDEARAAYRRFLAGEMTPDQYVDELERIDAAYSTKPPCVNGDGRIAVAIVQGRQLCEPCFTRERRTC